MPILDAPTFVPSPLYAIANLDSLVDSLDFIDQLLAADIELIQLRTKTLSSTALIELTRRVLSERDRRFSATSRRANILINDDVDICAEAGADGVHLGQTDSNPSDARARLGNSAIIGLSTHSLSQVRSAPLADLSYVALGPIFLSSTKSGHAEVVGLETLRLATALCPLPIVAIGGITRNSARSVFQAGASAVAVIADLVSGVGLDHIRQSYQATWEQREEVAEEMR